MPYNAAQGPYYGNGFTNHFDPPAGIVSWSNPGNAGSGSPNVYATVTVQNGIGSPSAWLMASGFNFNIPSGAIISGILLECSGKQSVDGNLGSCYSSFGLFKRDSFVGLSKNTFFHTTDTGQNLGDSSDLWDTTWTPSEINDYRFGCGALAYETSGTSTLVSLDFMTLQVFYATGASIASGAVPLYMFGIEGTQNSGIPLYMCGHAEANSGIPLYIFGIQGEVNSGIPLYMYGSDTSNSGIPLSVWGNDSSNSGIPLYIFGIQGTPTGDIPLYILGSLQNSGVLDLYLQGDRSIESTATIPLFMNSLTTGTNNGIFGGIDLFLYASGLHTDNISLFLTSDSSAWVSGNKTLFIEGHYNSLYGEIPLYLSNSGTSSEITLYISGYGLTPGALTASSLINLYMERPTSNVIPLFLLGNGNPVSGDIPLNLVGNVAVYNSLGLSLSGIGSKTGSVSLFTHGY